MPRRGESMFGRFIADCTSANEELQIVGLTATPFRVGSGFLFEEFEDEDALFSRVAFEYPYSQAVTDGYLCPLVSKEAATKLDVSRVRRRGNDFDDSELHELVATHDSGASLQELMKRGASRESWLCFCSGVQHTLDVERKLTFPYTYENM